MKAEMQFPQKRLGHVFIFAHMDKMPKKFDVSNYRLISYSLFYHGRYSFLQPYNYD